MSVIDRAVEKAGIELERDVPIEKQRRCRDWAKVIGLCRKLESGDAVALEEERRASSDITRKFLAVQDENFRLKAENIKLKLKERMREMELPEQDQQRLLTGKAVEAA